MSLTDFDKELISTNLLGATTLKELHQKEKISSPPLTFNSHTFCTINHQNSKGLT